MPLSISPVPPPVTSAPSPPGASAPAAGTGSFVAAAAPQPALADEELPIYAELDRLLLEASEVARDLSFRVDRDSGRIIVTVSDRNTGAVLRQIPSEDVMRVARGLALFHSGLVDHFD